MPSIFRAPAFSGHPSFPVFPSGYRLRPFNKAISAVAFFFFPYKPCMFCHFEMYFHVTICRMLLRLEFAWMGSRQNYYEEASMNWDQIEGKWKQCSGKVKEK